MSTPEEFEVLKALEDHAVGLSPAWGQKLPGVAYEPTGPHQKVFWMPGKPAKVAVGTGAYHRLRGVCQIDLMYPKTERKPKILLQRAAAMRRHFYPDHGLGLAITAGAGQLICDTRPEVSGLDEDSDVHFLRVFVSVPIRIELPPAS